MDLNTLVIIANAFQLQILAQPSIFMLVSGQLIMLTHIIHGVGLLVKQMPMIMVVFITVELIMMESVIFVIHIAKPAKGLIKLIALLAKGLIICGLKDQIIANKVAHWVYIHGIQETGGDNL